LNSKIFRLLGAERCGDGHRVVLDPLLKKCQCVVAHRNPLAMSNDDTDLELWQRLSSGRAENQQEEPGKRKGVARVKAGPIASFGKNSHSTKTMKL
jgi:hypothetical protein